MCVCFTKYFLTSFLFCVSQHCFIHPWCVAGSVLWGLLDPSELRLSAPASVVPSSSLPRLGPGASRPQPAGPFPPPTAVWAWSWWYEGRTGEGQQSRDFQNKMPPAETKAVVKMYLLDLFFMIFILQMWTIVLTYIDTFDIVADSVNSHVVTPVSTSWQSITAHMRLTTEWNL